ncbi:MAG TPA: hypothetical protein PLD38_13840 [Pyrinomonadaceae bacterium]|nr:hypothetical protein [Chloracidobacterium sp.]MBP9936527.1 hypothetical protein [Pyrinomonadaceae bacterium]MBK7802746.1 hypothetical protein [Chloracidobacterium sp.]MBK9437601.1 hypothetical protein [Chloracidobacterium sp.]HQY68356.1 hypothetical protein [Pyrinomonadaceae bacterium]
MSPTRRPMWLPASNYYALTMAVVIAFFFLVWGILHDGGDETPWISAGIGASAVLFGAVILREWVMRRARNRYVTAQRNFDRELREVYSRLGNDRDSEKLTLGQNEAILSDIAKKSSAARTLGKFSATHREVFELCGDYLARNKRELSLIGTGSPRLVPLRKSRDRVREFHRYHVLQWAEIEARELTQDAKSRAKFSEKVESAQAAMNVIDSAMSFYPAEPALIESREVIVELVASIKVAHWVERAERAAFKGDYKEARSHYRDALFYLGRDNISNEDRDIAADHINTAIERLRQLEQD